MKEKLKVEKYGGSLIIKIPKFIRDKHKVEKEDYCEVNFKSKK